MLYRVELGDPAEMYFFDFRKRLFGQGFSLRTQESRRGPECAVRPGEARVEFEGRIEDVKQLEGLLPGWLESAIDAELRVRVVGDPFTNRAIQIGDYKPIGCGGTYVQTLSDIAQIRITGVKKKRSRVRVSYDAVPTI